MLHHLSTPFPAPILAMKKNVIALLLFNIVCIAAPSSVVYAEDMVPISEQLGLRPVDPRPVAVAFVDPDNVSGDPKNIIEAKDWQFTNAAWSGDAGFMKMQKNGSALSKSLSTPPGFYYFQMDQHTVPVARSQVTVGHASFGVFQDAMYADWNSRWMTFSHFFRIPEAENQMKISIKTENIFDPVSVHFKNLQLLPAQALLNLAPKSQPLQDIYWGENAVSRTTPTGIFLPLGHWERIEQDYKTKKSIYRFSTERRLDIWGLYPAAMETATVFPPVSIEASPFEKMIVEPQHGQAWKIDEMILKFELRPVSIDTDGELKLLPPIRLLSARLNGNYLDHFNTHPPDGMFWSNDGKSWKKLNIELKLSAPDRIDWAHYPPSLPEELFPCERLYLKFTPVDGNPNSSRLSWLRFHAELDTDQYNNYGQTSYFRVVPGEAKENGMKVWGLYTARNQVYFLFRNDSDQALPPEFAVRLVYGYSEAAEPKEVLFQASGNKVEKFDDITCHWEVLGKEDKILPGEERICVFTLETSKLRVSSDFQLVSDVFAVEFDLGTYKLLNEQMRFPPRLAIE